MTDEAEIPPITITIAPAYGVHGNPETDDYIARLFRTINEGDELLIMRAAGRHRRRATWARGLALGE